MSLSEVNDIAYLVAVGHSINMSIRLFFCLFIIIKNSLALESPCYKEDFSNSFGIMDRSCDENFKSFALETFENQKDIPIPNYSNGYFIMSNDQGDSCIKSSATLSIPAGSTVDLNIFTKNSGNRSSRVLLTISDELGIAGFENEIVDNTAQWRSFIGNVFRGTSNGQVKNKNYFIICNVIYVLIVYSLFLDYYPNR